MKNTLKSEAIISSLLIKDNNTENVNLTFDKTKSRFTIINEDGTVTFDSDIDRDLSLIGNHRDRPEIIEANIRGEGFSVRKSETQNNFRAYFALKLSDEKKIVRVSQDYSEVLGDINLIIISEVFFFILLNFTIYTLYTIFLKRDLIDKIDSLRYFLETGKSSAALSKRDSDWIEKLWFVIQKWQKRNLENIEKLKYEKEILRNTIDSVDASIVLTDEDFRIIVKNNSLKELFIKKNFQNLRYAFKHAEFVTLLNEYENLKEDEYVKNIYLHSEEKHFLVVIKHLKEESNYLITVKDITLPMKVGEIQKNFVSNISHELKTPLTNIKGYLSALEDAPPPLQEKFFLIIRRNIDKLESIISSFLDISKLESSQLNSYEIIELSKLEKEISFSISGVLEKKNGKLKFSESFYNNTFIKSDYGKLLLILKNLAENGIIYNNKENPLVNIHFSENEKEYIFKVSDNGIGIEENKIPRIFERFYRVDEARTTNLSGSGLGLSIVKEGINKLKGSIEIDSSLNSGTTFIVKIPK